MKPRWHTLRLSPLKLLGGTLALLLAVWLVWNLVPRPDPLAETVRKRGYPVTPDELNAWYPAVPPAENAAFIYTNALARLTNSSSLVSRR